MYNKLKLKNNNKYLLGHAFAPNHLKAHTKIECGLRCLRQKSSHMSFVGLVDFSMPCRENYKTIAYYIDFFLT